MGFIQVYQIMSENVDRYHLTMLSYYLEDIRKHRGKSMKQLKWLSVMVCLIIVLAGCSSNNKNGGPAAESKSSTNASATKATESEQTESPSGDFPVGIIFGDWSDNPEVVVDNERPTFRADEPISLGMEMPEKFGVKEITINIYKKDNAQLLDSWDDSVDPDWEAFSYEFYDPETDEILEPGQYEVALFRDTTRIAEGTFNIQ